jgi:trans-aconitate 2-methyltransferase
MLRQARKRLPRCVFIEADLATWTLQEPADLLFANAVFQWVPDHQMAMRRLIEGLPPRRRPCGADAGQHREPHVLMQGISE